MGTPTRSSRDAVQAASAHQGKSQEHRLHELPQHRLHELQEHRLHELGHSMTLKERLHGLQQGHRLSTYQYAVLKSKECKSMLPHVTVFY